MLGPLVATYSFDWGRPGQSMSVGHLSQLDRNLPVIQWQKRYLNGSPRTSQHSVFRTWMPP